ncbi:uracil-DNA glycosylase [Metabacillus rhizolycopersici]|uniref:Uracil-DNA glycosylase n=1 Tax=Metabacillus rhizolycopersici TaxID=2875709 RepID=A0ABS7UTY7_9BACI|nr:uracil-DNA glycosylase [Metabacillus rhizolycopersici]MBZ5751775.1 uracil-DNA glycosylase [Metabacillus rhizolycopersici]
MEKPEANCVKCTHFYITWDTKLPNGCRAYGFKSARRPAIMVKKLSGNRVSKI